MKDLIIGFQHLGLPTKDMKATREFYDKLGFEVWYETLNEGNQVVFFKLKDLVIEAYESDEVAMAHGAIDHVSIDVTDVHKVYEHINAIGLNNINDTIHHLHFFENGVEYFMIEGPNKEKIEFNQYL